MTRLSGEFGSGGAAVPQAPAGLDPRLVSAVGDQNTTSQQAFTGADSSAQKGKTGIDGLAKQDEVNGRKADGVNTALKDGAGTGRGADGPGKLGRADAPRLGAADLARLGQYQSPMPAMQSTPSMPTVPAMPMSGAAAPIQSMLGGPGAVSPMLSKLMATGGPPSMPLTSATLARDATGEAGKLRQLVNGTLGTPYAWGGGSLNGPSKGISDHGGPADRAGDYNKVGYDCSGLARYVTYQMTGHEIPRTSEAQYTAGMAVSASEARPGDLVFPNSAGRPPGHVQVYLGGNQVLEAPSSGQTVKISPLRPCEFRRMVA